MKKVLACILLVVTVIGVGTKSVYASEPTQNISGGWSESSGYYQNTNIRTKSTEMSIMAAASSSPSSHTGKRLSRVWNSGGDVEVAAYGETIWKNKYHYTTARTENRKGKVYTTSGRKYGTGYTNATSPYYRYALFENVECKTYWGL